MKRLAPLIVLIVIALLAYFITKPPKLNKQKLQNITKEKKRMEQPNSIVKFNTTMGSFEVELENNLAPQTVENFLKYVKSGYYEGLIFHRVIRKFVAQGGGFLPGMKEKSPEFPPVVNEASVSKLRNSKYTIAMARTNLPNSATSQFYINLKDNNMLDWDKSQDGYGYCVFGKVISGKDVIDSIGNVKTKMARGFRDVPVEDIIINSVEIVK